MDTNRFRQTTPEDAQALLDVERAAGIAALGHIFPPGTHHHGADERVRRGAATAAAGELDGTLEVGTVGFQNLDQQASEVSR